MPDLKTETQLLSVFPALQALGVEIKTIWPARRLTMEFEQMQRLFDSKHVEFLPYMSAELLDEYLDWLKHEINEDKTFRVNIEEVQLAVRMAMPVLEIRAASNERNGKDALKSLRKFHKWAEKLDTSFDLVATEAFMNMKF